MRKTVAILGVPIDILDRSETMERLDEFIASGRFHQVATANTDFLVNAQRDPELMTILRMADLVVPDGMPLVLASRWLRFGVRERVTGADLVPALAKRAAEKGYRIYLLGGRPEVAEAAAERMTADNPGLSVVGRQSPPLSHVVEMDHEGILADIAAEKPDVLLVAFGNPKQEKWIHMNRDRLAVPVCIGIGGTFDFLAGRITRAPGWMQRAGLEWGYRLGKEPGRLWKRYWNDLVHFSRLIAAQLWTARVGGRPATFEMETAGSSAVLSPSGSLSGKELDAFQELCDGALNSGKDLILDLQSTETIDSAILGTLINLPKRAAHVGRRFRIVGARGGVRAALQTAGVGAVAEMCETFAQAVAAGAGPGGHVKARVEDNGLFLSIEGRADYRLVDRVKASLEDSLAAGRPVEIDLRSCTFADCAMLRLLMASSERARGQGSRFQLRMGAAFRDAVKREGLQGRFPDEPRSGHVAATTAVGGTTS